MAVGYAKLLDKARKLKALADRGNEGERESAKKFYSDFLKKNSISEKEVDSERFKRIFKLIDSEYEIIVSYIIMSVNPFCEIKRAENGTQFMVSLDDEDYIEAEYKFNTFHSLFKKDEKRIISHYKHFGDNKSYDREKLILITAFLNFHKAYFQPDEYAVKKNRGDDGKKVNPDMAQSVKNTNPNDESLQEKIRKAEEDYKKNKHKYDQQEVIMFNEEDMGKIQLYTDMLTPTWYVRANKTLTEPEKIQKSKIGQAK
jgi:hypothetical protein